MTTVRLVSFVGGDTGGWRVDRIEPVRGKPLDPVARLSIVEDETIKAPDAGWVLRGAVSNERYVTRAEHEQLAARQAPLGRPEATQAALIPISKSPRWWSLAQDERRDIFEEQGRHIAASLPYLPAIARRLHHGRDLGEPFDFLTWFEYAPEHADEFERLVDLLRAGPEWRYVVREVDLRLTRVGLPAAAVRPCRAAQIVR
jgi:Chlorite dismutase